MGDFIPRASSTNNLNIKGEILKNQWYLTMRHPPACICLFLAMTVICGWNRRPCSFFSWSARVLSTT